MEILLVEFGGFRQGIGVFCSTTSPPLCASVVVRLCHLRGASFECELNLLIRKAVCAKLLLDALHNLVSSVTRLVQHGRLPCRRGRQVDDMRRTDEHLAIDVE